MEIYLFILANTVAIIFSLFYITRPVQEKTVESEDQKLKESLKEVLKPVLNSTPVKKPKK